MSSFTVKAGNSELFSTSSGVIERGLIDPQLSLEIGKAGSFDFTITPLHPLYDQIELMKTIITVFWDDIQIYRGRVLSLDTDVFKQRKVSCEGDIAFMNDVVMEKGKHTETPKAFFERCVNYYHDHASTGKQFTVGNVTIKEREKAGVEFDLTSYTSVLSAIESQLISKYGGYLNVRYENGVYYLDYLEKFTGTCDQRIEFSQNLLDLSEQVEGDSIFSVILPTGNDNKLISDAVTTGTTTIGPNNVKIKTTTGSPTIEIVDAVTKYGKITRVYNFNDEKTAADVFTKAKEFIIDNYKPYPARFSVKAIDFHYLDSETEMIMPGNKVMIKSIPHGMNNVSILCTAIQMDILNPENTEYTFEDPTQEDNSSQGGGGSGGSGGRGGGSASGSSVVNSNNIQWDKEKVLIVSNSISIIAEEQLWMQAKLATIDTSQLEILARFTVLGDTVLNQLSEFEKDLLEKGVRILAIEEEGIRINTKFNDVELNLLDQGKRIVAVEADAIRLGDGLTEAQGAIVAHGQTLTAINTDVTNITSQITSIGGEVSQQALDLSNLHISVTEISSDVIKMGGDLTETQLQLAEDGRKIAAINTDITSINSQLVSIGGDISQQAIDLSNMNISVAEINSQVVKIGGDLNDAEVELAEQGRTITRINSQVISLGTGLDDAQSELAEQYDRIVAINADAVSIHSELVELKARQYELDAENVNIATQNFHLDLKSDNQDEIIATIDANQNGLRSDFESSVLWQNVDEIGALVALDLPDKAIARDADGNIVFKTGLVINRGGSQFGIFEFKVGDDGTTEKTLTGGMMVQMINGQTTTKIKGDRIQIGDDNNPAILVDVLNSKVTMTQVEAKIGTYGFLKADELKAKIADITALDTGFITASTFTCDGSAIFNSGVTITGDSGLGSPVIRYDSDDIGPMLVKSITSSKSNGTITLTFNMRKGDAQTVTFNAADLTNLVGSWGGDTYTVKADGDTRLTTKITTSWASNNGDGIGVLTIKGSESSGTTKNLAYRTIVITQDTGFDHTHHTKKVYVRENSATGAILCEATVDATLEVNYWTTPSV